MYVPTNVSLLGSLTPVAAVDATLNSLLHISWMVLLPYTLFGIALMAYGHSRLMRGERMLKREQSVDNSVAATAALEPIA